LIFGLVYVSHASEVGTDVSCEESTTISPSMGLIVSFWLLGTGAQPWVPKCPKVTN